ncbi:hypothetical protein ACFLUJ_03505 [Chloroflexota bacterium]
MLNQSMVAGSLWVKVIHGLIYNGKGNQPLEDDVNAWLQGHSDHEIYDICFQQSIDPNNKLTYGSALITYKHR